MAALSDYLEGQLIDHIFRNSTFTRPANIYVALFTAALNDAGGGTEVSGGSYARVAVATGGSSGWDAASGGATANTNAVIFPAATDDWGEIAAVGLFDALTNGNLLFHGGLTTNKTVNSGDIFQFGQGDLQISLT